MSFRFSTHGGERYAGAPAAIWGIMAFVVGASVIAAAYLMEEGLWQTTTNYLARRPGPLVAGGGLLVACTGMLLMFNRGRSQGLAWKLLVRTPKTMVGMLLALAGAGAIGLGIWEVIQPRAYQRFVLDMGRYIRPEEIRWLWRTLLLPR